MTISLSNIHKWNEQSHPKKLIQLKSVHAYKEKTKDQQSTDQDPQLVLKLAQQEVEQSKAEAQRILEEARQQAETIKNETIIQKEKAMKEAKDSGYDAGYQEGLLKAEQEHEALIKTAQQIVSQTEKEYRSVLINSEQDIVQIAIKSAEKILHQKLIDEPENFIKIVKATIKEVIEQSDIMIKVHPNEYGLITEYREEIEQLFPNKAKITLYPDETLSHKSCIVESPYGIIDSSIDTQLEQLKQHLLGLTKGVE